MKPTHDFTAERPLAQHCATLIERIQPPIDNQQAMHDFIAEFCLAVPERLQGLLVGPRGQVSVSEPQVQTGASLENEHRQGSVHFLLKQLAGPDMLLSFKNSTALALTDRIFGGDGQFSQAEEGFLPQSAILAVERVARVLGGAYATAIDIDPTPVTITSERNVARLAPFQRREYCVGWTLEIEQSGSANWQATATFCESALTDFLGSSQARRSKTGAKSSSLPIEGVAGQIPLQLTAVLAELSLPLSTLASLTPGQTIPLSLSRSVPLKIDGKTLAFGTVGVREDRIALQLIPNSMERKLS